MKEIFFALWILFPEYITTDETFGTEQYHVAEWVMIYSANDFKKNERTCDQTIKEKQGAYKMICLSEGEEPTFSEEEIGRIIKQE